MKPNKNLIDYRIEFIIGIHTPFIDSIAMNWNALFE